MTEVIGIIVIGSILLAFMRPRADFVIEVSGDQVQFTGTIPSAARPRITDFFAKDVATNEKVKILGKRRRDGIVSYKFRGKLTTGDCQQIRNFLKTVL